MIERIEGLTGILDGEGHLGIGTAQVNVEAPLQDTALTVLNNILHDLLARQHDVIDTPLHLGIAGHKLANTGPRLSEGINPIRHGEVERRVIGSLRDERKGRQLLMVMVVIERIGKHHGQYQHTREGEAPPYQTRQEEGKGTDDKVHEKHLTGEESTAGKAAPHQLEHHSHDIHHANGHQRKGEDAQGLR